MTSTVDRLEASFFKALRPPPRLTVAEWAERYAQLSPESSAEPGPWRNLPYQVGIQEAFTDPELEEVWVMKSARVGWTKMLGNLIGYHVHQDPCSMLMVQPTDADAEGYSKEELATMIRDTPVLTAVVADVKTRDGGNTLLSKSFPGGVISLTGANSGAGFRRISRHVVMFDEIDAYPESAGTEGDPIKLGIKRTEYYWNRKIVGGTTPLLKGTSRIEKLFDRGDQRFYFVPCPHCGHMAPLVWENKDEDDGSVRGHWFKIPEAPEPPEGAHFVCVENGCVIEHESKYEMLERGEWRATSEGRPKVASFHIWAAYSTSPNASWGVLAREWIDVLQTKDKNQIQVYVNTVRGELWEEDYVKKVSADELANRAEFYESNVLPVGAVLATVGVDVQDNRLAVAIYGWGEGEEAWCVNWFEIFGDPAKPEIWKQLDQVLFTPIRHVNGKSIPIAAVAIDTGGHFTQEVYQYVRSHRGKMATTAVLAVKGASQKGKQAIGRPTAQDVNFKGQKIIGGVDLHAMGSDTIKSTLYARFKNKEQGPRYFHFNTDLPREFFDQLMAEKQVIKRNKKSGLPSVEWVLPAGKRNEALDCTVMSYAALQWLYMRFVPKTLFAQFARKLGVVAPAKPAVSENKDAEESIKPPEETNRPARTNTVTIQRNRRGGFVHRY